MRPEKRARPEKTNSRKGMSLRADRGQWVVEMRPHGWSGKHKLWFGSFVTEAEAMLSRDYGAHLRMSAGEKAQTAGGYDTTELYYFDESPDFFNSLPQTADRCARIGLLYVVNGTGESRTHFCDLARKDIESAIRLFSERYPHHRLPTSRILPAPGQMDAAMPSSSSRVSPADLPPLAQVAVGMDGSLRRIVVDIQAPHLDDEVVKGMLMAALEAFKIDLEEAVQNKLDLNKAMFVNDWMLEDLTKLPPCPYNPLSITPIDDLPWIPNIGDLSWSPNNDDLASTPAIDDPASKSM